MCAVVAGILFASAGILGLHSTTPFDRQSTQLDMIPAAEATVAPAEIKDWIKGPEVATRFAPVLEFAPEQTWAPIGASEYLDHAKLYRYDGTLANRKPSVDNLPGTCPRGSALPCYYLTISCPLQANSPSKAARRTKNCAGQDDELEATPANDTSVVYGRVVRERRPGRTLTSYGPYAESLTTIVQYWLFYYYDDWWGHSLFGTVRQSHEADWEAVTIGFSTDKPLFVAYSAHCGGSWLRWENVKVAAKKMNMALRTVVAVAKGSQANYNSDHRDFAPDWAGCAGSKNEKVSAASFAYNIRDVTGRKAIRWPTVKLTDRNGPVMGFPGYWGKAGRMSFTTRLGRTYGLPSDPNGPTSPPQHALWWEPTYVIFCDKRWRPEGAAKNDPDRRQNCP